MSTDVYECGSSDEYSRIVIISPNYIHIGIPFLKWVQPDVLKPEGVKEVCNEGAKIVWSYYADMPFLYFVSSEDYVFENMRNTKHGHFALAIILNELE